jgi:hypothetical protein
LRPCFQGGRASRRTGTGAGLAAASPEGCCSGPAAAFAAAPSHIPSDPLLARSTPRPLPGPLSTFRKIHLYGKTKKSTHGHTTATPIRPHPWILAQGGNRGRPMQPANFPARQATRWPAARTLQGRSIRLQGRPQSTYPGPPTCPATAQAAPGAADGPGDEREDEGKELEAGDGPRLTAFVSTFFVSSFFFFFFFPSLLTLAHVGRCWLKSVDIRRISNIVQRQHPPTCTTAGPPLRAGKPPLSPPPSPSSPSPSRISSTTTAYPGPTLDRAATGAPGHPREAPGGPPEAAGPPAAPFLSLPPTRDPADRPTLRPSTYPAPTQPTTLHPPACPVPQRPREPQKPSAQRPGRPKKAPDAREKPQGKGPPAAPRLLTTICILPTLHLAAGPRPASSHVLRAAGCPAHASPASGATFDFPQNSGRPPKTTDLPCSRILPTLHLPPDGQEDERRRTGKTDTHTDRQDQSVRIRARPSLFDLPCTRRPRERQITKANEEP